MATSVLALTQEYAPLATITKKVYFDITLEGNMLGRIVFGLYGDVVPKTVENFVQIAQGTQKSKTTGKVMTYKGTKFHRIINNFMAQGGDFEYGNGRGGESIYGKNFADENFELGHPRPYLLSMANAGPNTNGSQFFITFRETSWLDGKHVTFGEVLGGKDVVDVLNQIGTQDGKPKKTAVIVDCGVFEE